MPPLLIALRIPESGGEPLETLVETVTRSGASGLDELQESCRVRYCALLIAIDAVEELRIETYPSTLSQAVQAELVRNLGSRHGVLTGLLAADSRKSCTLMKKRGRGRGLSQMGTTYGKILLVGEDK